MMKTKSIESQLLLRLFIDSRPNIKQTAYTEMLSHVCNTQAHSPALAPAETPQPSHNTTYQADSQQLKDMLEIEVVPEME
jgi:hypothetical protein